MSYAVKELFYTLQGEGNHTGRAAVFCRFTGCNLWSGRAEDRARASCQFCDTDFVGTDGPGGGRFATPEELADRAQSIWVAAGGPPSSSATPGGTPGGRPLVVCTGGEPLLQLDAPLVAAFHAAGFEVAIETNGTLELPAAPEPSARIDWVCVSPKSGTALRIEAGHELKLVYPQAGAEPERYAHLPFSHFFLQPMDGPARAENTELAVRYCLLHPQWRLSLQTHKLLGIP
jgi:7-carboxy-7-deazaguanine synthase (Cx14CxxC type)